MRNRDTNPNALLWHNLFKSNENEIEGIVKNGILIMEYEKLQAKDYLDKYAFSTKIKNYNALVVNKGKVNSLFFNSHFDPNLHDLMCSFIMSPNQSWYVSFYSPTIDCSELAKSFGGGGHKGAAGYSSTTLPFSLPSPGFLED